VYSRAPLRVFELPQRILARHVDDFVLVSDDDLRSATLKLLELTRNVIEPALAVPLAAALKLHDRLSGRRIALVCSGGNVNPRQLREPLDWGTRAPTRGCD
jgi:threonine dehydratase